MSVNVLYMDAKNMFENGYHLNSMECSCGDIAFPSFADKKYRFDGKTITVKNIPVLKCKTCGELYSDFIIDARTEEQAYKAMQESKSEIEFN